MCSKVWKSLNSVQFSSIQFSLSVMSDSLRSHEPQHTWISDLFYCSQPLPTYYTVWHYFQYFLKTKLINWHESDLFHYHCHENIIIVIKNNKITRIIFTFFAPLVSIVTCYCCITRKLCVHYQHSGKHNKKLRKSIKIIFIVVAAFVLFWLPFNTFKLLAIVSGLQEELSLSSAFLQRGMEVCGPLAFANSCVNPFIYYVFDGYIRRAIVRCLCPCLKNYDFGSSTETSDLTKALSNFIHAEDFARKRKRSVSLWKGQWHFELCWWGWRVHLCPW